MIYVTSNTVNDTFRGYTLELPKKRTPEGTYKAHLREDHNPTRIELEHVPNMTYIQIHSGNKPSHTFGCILVGKTRTKDRVWSSIPAMNEILKN